jgi:hypothetical protein
VGVMHALRSTIKRAKKELPEEWHHIIGMEAGAARAHYMRNAKADPIAAREVWTGYLDQYGGASSSNLSDGEIKAQAKAYAEEAENLEIGLLTDRPYAEYERLIDFCKSREVAQPPVKLMLSGMGKRVRCPYWWRRALRKMVAQKSERGHMAMGLVSLPAHQPYASNQAVFRRIAQNVRNREALENITIENEDGYRATLAELSDKSVANKSIRRGELMTRIRGCEEIADACGHAGLFVTATCPSRFHSTLRNGRRNQKFDGSTPKDAQDWLCKMWQKTRAKLARQGVTVYGFRVAEPHHDGCPHWHLLIWADNAHALSKFETVMTDYWLSDAGEESGAQKYRIQFKVMIAGGAASYIAKYISKNIDDHGIDSHLDDYAESAIGTDLLGDVEIKPCHRVEAWASTWRIRQFQPLGQPPVTVWRELRRVTANNALLAGGDIKKAWTACQKTVLGNASWAGYCKAQGGLMQGRKCRIRLALDRREVVGLYGRDLRNIPIGVRLNLAGARTVWSERRLWRVVDTVAAVLPVSVPMPVLECAFDKRSASARTRVNNCTQAVQAVRLENEKTPEILAQLAKMQADFEAEFPYSRFLPPVNDLAAYFSESLEY